MYDDAMYRTTVDFLIRVQLTSGNAHAYGANHKDELTQPIHTQQTQLDANNASSQSLKCVF